MPLAIVDLVLQGQLSLSFSVDFEHDPSVLYFKQVYVLLWPLQKSYFFIINFYFLQFNLGN